MHPTRSLVSKIKERGQSEVRSEGFRKDNNLDGTAESQEKEEKLFKENKFTH